MPIQNGNTVTAVSCYLADHVPLYNYFSHNVSPKGVTKKITVCMKGQSGTSIKVSSAQLCGMEVISDFVVSIQRDDGLNSDSDYIIDLPSDQTRVTSLSRIGSYNCTNTHPVSWRT